MGEPQRGIRPQHMGAIGLMEPNLGTERPRPVCHGAVVVRVGDGDPADPTEGFHQCDGRGIQQRDAVPQDVPLGPQDQQGALVLGALREAGFPQRAVFVHDFPPRRLANLRALYGDVHAVPSFDAAAIRSALAGARRPAR